MTTTTPAGTTGSRKARVPPPFRPDPKIIGNIEGNRRIQRHDQEAAREYLRQHFGEPDEQS